MDIKTLSLAIASLIPVTSCAQPGTDVRASQAPQPATATQPCPTVLYGDLWESAKLELARDLRDMEAWLASTAPEARTIPDALAARCRLHDPYPFVTSVELHRGTKTEAESVRDNWREWAGALRRVCEDVPKTLLVAPTAPNEYRRTELIRDIGSKASHPAFAPLLLAMIRNPTEDTRVRTRAVRALALTPHSDVVPNLTDLLREPDRDVSSTAFGCLWGLTDYNAANQMYHETGAAPKASLELVPPYEKWWVEHRQTFNYEQGRENLRSRSGPGR